VLLKGKWLTSCDGRDLGGLQVRNALRVLNVLLQSSPNPTG